MKHISSIDSACEVRTKNTYKRNDDHREYVVKKPLEAAGFLKWKIRIYKAFYILTGKADAFTYNKNQ